MDVLIIHDDQTAMEQLVGIVSVFDVSIVSGAGLDDVGDAPESFDPQLFLVSYDLQMGEALLEKLRDRYGDIRSDQIIFLIDDGGDADVRESLLASGADVLVAPFVEGEVRTRVSYHIKVATLEREHAIRFRRSRFSPIQRCGPHPQSYSIYARPQSGLHATAPCSP